MVDDIASVSRQTATEAETAAAAAAEEQTATVSEVTRRVHALSDQSDELLATLDEFDVPESDEGLRVPVRGETSRSTGCGRGRRLKNGPIS